MFSRIKKITEREKSLNPNLPASLLLMLRLKSAAAYKFKKFKNAVYLKVSKNSTFYSSEEMGQCSLFPSKILELVIEEYKPTSILDVGCGTGVSMNYFLDKGIDVLGLENSIEAINLAKHPEKILKRNLNKYVPLNRRFDLVWCFEVIEHIHPKYENEILQTLTSFSNNIILSAAKPGQGGFGHFNEQLPEYWIKNFALYGFEFQQQLTEKFRQTWDICSDNILCFKKK